MKDDESELETEDDMRNDEWVKAHFINLIQEHPREWVAVLDRVVIAHGSTKTEVQENADKVAGDREYSIYFIPPTETTTDAGYYQHEEARKSS